MIWQSELESHLHLTAGWLCLDFANTNDMHASDSPIESLHNYDGLLNWAETRGVLQPGQTRLLRDLADQAPEQAMQVYGQAIELREFLYRTFSALATDHGIKPVDLKPLNQALKSALPNMFLVQQEQGYTWEWDAQQLSLDFLLWPISFSAAELLQKGELRRLGECADEAGCGWLFFDTTKNHSRRWCDMKDCGNRDKVRRYYQRQSLQTS